MQIVVVGNNHDIWERTAIRREQFDIVVPSISLLPALARVGVVRSIPRDRLGRYGNVEPQFRSSMNLDTSGNLNVSDVAVPYAIVQIGILYRPGGSESHGTAAALGEPLPRGWGIFDDPTLAQHMTFLDDKREAFAAALLAKGRSINTENEAELDEPALTLQGWLSRANFNSTTYPSELAAGAIDLAQAYPSDVESLADRSNAHVEGDGNSDVLFVIPDRRGPISVEVLCIGAGVVDLDLSLAFIDYLLEAESCATNMQWTSLRSPSVPGLVEYRDGMANAKRPIHASILTMDEPETTLVLRALSRSTVQRLDTLWERLVRSKGAERGD